MAAVLRYQSQMECLASRFTRSGHAIVTATNEVCVARTTNEGLRPYSADQSPSVSKYSSRACSYPTPETSTTDLCHTETRRADIGLVGLRRHLDDLLVAVYQLVSSDLNMFRYWDVDSVPYSWRYRRDQALEEFQQWLDLLEKSMPSDIVTFRSHGVVGSKGVLGLVLQIKVAMILLRTCIDSGPESTFDQYTSDFEEIVSRVEYLSRMSRATTQQPHEYTSVLLTMGLGVLHPLFFVAVKCRDWSLRRRAIAQLENCGKEGVWDGSIMAAVAKRVVEIEEEGMQYGGFVPERARIHDLRKSIMYEERVVMLEMRLAGNEHWQNWVVRRECIKF